MIKVQVRVDHQRHFIRGVTERREPSFEVRPPRSLSLRDRG